jgi:hypothetical protein
LSWNYTNDSEDATALSTPSNDWGQLKAGSFFKECVSCDRDSIILEVQTCELMMGENFTFVVSEV